MRTRGSTATLDFRSLKGCQIFSETTLQHFLKFKSTIYICVIKQGLPMTRGDSAHTLVGQ